MGLDLFQRLAQLVAQALEPSPRAALPFADLLWQLGHVL
jgi:hypothetical protein